MEFLDYMLIYFKGEKSLGFFLIGLGIAVLIFVGYLWQVHKGGLAYGMIIPLLIFGLAGIGGGGFLAYRTNSQISELTSLYQSTLSSKEDSLWRHSQEEVWALPV